MSTRSQQVTRSDSPHFGSRADKVSAWWWLATLVLWAMTSAANAANRIEFNVAPQAADRALVEFARQAGVSVLLPSEQITQVTTNALEGSYELNEALAILLRNTGLTGEVSAAGTLIVRNIRDLGSERVGTTKKSNWFSNAMVSLAAALSLGGHPASAQTARDELMDEVVVTATRRSDTVHNVPLSITAVTPKQWEDEGLKNAEDLARVVPALQVRDNNGTDVSIRGIRSTVGLPTTGIYIDDVALPQRLPLNPVPGGTVLPPLFDLDRIEVLRGPQGTLYGSSSEGGTIRSITKQPSVTDYSGQIRVEGSQTQGGGAGYDLGVALGGPIIQDHLGFRISGSYRLDPGYIDHVSQYTGAALAENTNWSEHTSVRPAFAWQLNENATITLAYLYTRDYYNDTDTYWQSIPQYQAKSGPAPGVLTTYGPYNFGAYNSGLNTNVGSNFYTSDSQLQPLLQPNETQLSLPSLTGDFQFGNVTVKSITALVQIKNESTPNFSYAEPLALGGTTSLGCSPGLPTFPYACSLNTLPASSPYIANLANFNATYSQQTKTQWLSQELRASSNPADSRWGWLGGAYFNHMHQASSTLLSGNFGQLISAIDGAPAAQTAKYNGNYLFLGSHIEETQLSAFGTASYKITSSLKATAGVRYTHDTQQYFTQDAGPAFNLPTGVIATAVNGSATANPVTPKAGLEYTLNPDINFYTSAAKGFRPGGVNGGSPSSCSAILAAAGYPNGPPKTYGPDSLWSYELGTKMRGWDGRASANFSIYRIDWTNVQTNIQTTCGPSFAVALANAVSKGGDLQTEFRLFGGLVATFNLAYTDARYTSTVKAGATTLINNGDRMPYTSEWTGSVGAQYNFNVGKQTAFVRADYQYASSFVLTQGPGTISYFPDDYRLPGTRYVSTRAGITLNGNLDLAAFVNNVTNSTDLLDRTGLNSSGAGATFGRGGCTNADCTAYGRYNEGAALTGFRPRTFGISIDYRF